MSNEANICDVFIAGGGLAGLSLAISLSHSGLSVIVADPAPVLSEDDARQDTRTTALMHGSVSFLKEIGVWPQCAQYATPLEYLEMVDARGKGPSPAQVLFDPQEARLDAFGQNIPNAALRYGLYELAKACKTLTCIKAGFEDYAVEDGYAHIQCSDQKTYKARLLIGADGRQSAVRKRADIPLDYHDHDQLAITCQISHSRPHHYTSTEIHYRGGPFTYVPLEGKRSSIVWVEKTQDAEELLSLRKDDFVKVMQQKSQDRLGTLTLESFPESWKMVSFSARKLAAPRMVLMAEAAHALHPIGAQGLNLSLRDVSTLADLIKTYARLGLDIGSDVLTAEYARKRSFDVTSRRFITDMLNRTVTTPNPLLDRARRLGLRGLSNSFLLRQNAMIYGMGTSI